MGGWRLLPSGSLKSALRGPHRGAGPLRCLAAPASRLPPRVMQPSGLRPSPTDAAAETGRWATSHRDVAAPKGEPSLASPFGGRWCPVGTVQRRPSRQARVPSKGGRRGQPASVSTQPMRGAAGNLPSQSRLTPCQLSRRESQVSPPPLGEVPSKGGRRGHTAGSRPSFWEATFLALHRPGKAWQSHCFPSFLSCAARL